MTPIAMLSQDELREKMRHEVLTGFAFITEGVWNDIFK
jgi:hypothetical protein